MGILYFANAYNAISRKMVDWAMVTDFRADLVLDALETEVGQRRPKDVTHDSDQDRQYTPVA